MQKYYVYILYSLSLNKYYTGYTSDIDTRLQKHNAGATRSTKSGRPWVLLYQECFESKTEAIIREKEIKRKKSRKYIEQLANKS